MGRANPFGALAAGLTVDELLLLREAADERHRRDEIVVGTLAGAKASYRPDPRRRGAARGAWRDWSTAAGVPRWRCRSDWIVLRDTV